ncbi:CHAP domain-containing protein [Streptomyces sp. NPDC101393]|uniref:CHAP domain-containing protein n=1 Tax=Streptomyces sp. NPDC101393 TaxID=3366141 RepID=UPI0037F6B153
MTATAADVIKAAKSEVGTQETRSGGHWVNDSKFNKWYGSIPGYGRGGYDYPWCAVFVAWCAEKAGAKGLYPVTAGCATAVNWYRGKGQFSEYPAIGAQVFFGPGGGTHTGLVYDYDDTYIYTVEGNTNTNGSAEGDGVYRRQRARRDSNVYGYGYPAFAEGIKSADPAWASKAPKPSVPAKPATPAKPKPAPKPVVDLSNVVAAAKRDPGLRQGGTTHAADVKRVEAALKSEGFLSAAYASDGSYGTSTLTAYAKWQRKLGYSGTDADGIPGMTSLKKLGAAHGFTVKG